MLRMQTSEFAYLEPRPGVLTLHGELTISTARELHAVLFATLDQHGMLELDLLNVTKLDTAGVQLLVAAHREISTRGKQLRWLGFSLAVQDMFELLDLGEMLGRPGAVLWS